MEEIKEFLKGTQDINESSKETQDFTESSNGIGEITESVKSLEINSDENMITFFEDYESLEFEDMYSFVCSTETPSFDELPENKANAGDQTPPSLVTPDESELQGMTEEEKVKQRQIWQQELAKIEEEIQTLKHVLQSKQRDSQELKKKLGISVWKELTDDISQGVQNVKESNAYQNVEEKFSKWGKAIADAPIYQKTESVMKATVEATRFIIGDLAGGFTQKIGQLKNSESFKSLEEKVGSAYENVKTKVSTSRSTSMQSFNEALDEETTNKNSNVKSPPSAKVKPFF